jgi:hypothetical protein
VTASYDSAKLVDGSGSAERAARGQAGEAERGLWVAWIEAWWGGRELD